VLSPQRVCCNQLGAMLVQHARAAEQARANTCPRKINVTSKSPVGDISVVTLIRTDTTLDHSQKAEKVCLTPKNFLVSSLLSTNALVFVTCNAICCKTSHSGCGALSKSIYISGCVSTTSTRIKECSHQRMRRSFFPLGSSFLTRNAGTGSTHCQHSVQVWSAI